MGSIKRLRHRHLRGEDIATHFAAVLRRPILVRARGSEVSIVVDDQEGKWKRGIPLV